MMVAEVARLVAPAALDRLVRKVASHVFPGVPATVRKARLQARRTKELSVPVATVAEVQH